MRTYRTKPLLYMLGIVITLLIFASCEESDKYIDWKVMNDEWYQNHKNDEGFTITESGLCYRLIGAATNPEERSPNPTDFVAVNYTRSYIDGIVISSTTSSILLLPEEIAGLREGITKMRHGETYEFYIPQNIGYGTTASGIIPPYTTLIYRVTLIDSGVY